MKKTTVMMTTIVMMTEVNDIPAITDIMCY